jgi:hypothetical protein
MNNRILLTTLTLALLTLPALASAHERQLINIGGTDYLFTVGSLNEPIIVDDKTGVDLRVKIADPKDPTNASASGAKPVTDLDQTLKVEVIAGDKKKTIDLSPAYNDPGAYKNAFFPTVQTTFSYRFFGTINNNAVDITFTCNPAGHIASPEDKSEVKLGEGVTRKYKTGQFGCPEAKDDLGFPEASMSVNGLHENVHEEMEAMHTSMMNNTPDQTGAALSFGLIGTILGGIALWKSRRSKAE